MGNTVAKWSSKNDLAEDKVEEFILAELKTAIKPQ